MGFQRDKVKEKFRGVTRQKPKKQGVKLKKDLLVDEMISHAICALGLRHVETHMIQNEVTEWIRSNYTFITPETVMREWRRMVASGEHDIIKTKEGKFVHFQIKRLFDLPFNTGQCSMF